MPGRVKSGQENAGTGRIPGNPEFPELGEIQNQDEKRRNLNERGGREGIGRREEGKRRERESGMK